MNEWQSVAWWDLVGETIERVDDLNTVVYLTTEDGQVYRITAVGQHIRLEVL